MKHLNFFDRNIYYYIYKLTKYIKNNKYGKQTFND